MAINGQSFLKAALLIAASAGLSGCVSDVGLGVASNGYYDDAYGCDPYGGYNAYYNCDYGQAFSNIDFGGGWYDNYYYPGHGIFLFDTFGRRYPMREQYRRYWGERRHSWHRENRGRDNEGGRYPEPPRGYTHNATPRVIVWRERPVGRIHGRDVEKLNVRRQGRKGPNKAAPRSEGTRVGAPTEPNLEVKDGSGKVGSRADRDGLRGRHGDRSPNARAVRDTQVGQDRSLQHNE